MKLMTRGLAFGAAIAALTAVATPASAAQPSAASDLLDAFGHHRIVALGQVHGLRQEDDFVTRTLLRHPRFAQSVDSIVVEFGNARYQARVDRYVAGGHVSPRALRPVWRDLVGAAPDGVLDAPAPFFAAVRRLNQTLPPARRIRVALGDPAFDFRKLRRRQDLERAGMQRDRVFAAAVEREARRGGRVLMLSGFMHVARLSPRRFGGDNTVQILERRRRGRVWVVLPYNGSSRHEDDFERRFIGRWSPVAVRPLTGTLGEQPADRLLPDLMQADPSTSPYPGLELKSVADAVISLGPCSKLRATVVSRAPLREPAYRAELDRRSRVLTGKPYVPPPPEPADAPYCPSSGEPASAL